jgi:hypothetical protein
VFPGFDPSPKIGFVLFVSGMLPNVFNSLTALFLQNIIPQQRFRPPTGLGNGPVHS